MKGGGERRVERMEKGSETEKGRESARQRQREDGRV
jgi:hypothetical protein